MLYVKETQGVPAPERRSRRPRGRRARRGALEDLDAARVVIGVFGGSGFYRFLDEVEEVPVATPVRAAVGAGPGRARGGRRRGLHAAPRRRAHAAAAPDQLPRQRLGDAGGRGAAASSARPPAARSSRSSPPGTFVICDQFVDRTQARESTFYDGPQTTHVSAADPYCADLSEILAASAERARHPGCQGRHRGRDPGAALLHPRGVALVRERRLRRGQHDPVPGGLAGPGAGALLRQRLARDRLRRGAGGHARRGARVRRWRPSRCSARTSIGCARCCSDAIPRIGPQPQDACATALHSAIVR